MPFRLRDRTADLQVMNIKEIELKHSLPLDILLVLANTYMVSDGPKHIDALTLSILSSVTIVCRKQMGKARSV